MKLKRAKDAINELFGAPWEAHMRDNLDEIARLVEDHIKGWALRKKTIIELGHDLAWGLEDGANIRLYLHPESFGFGEWVGIMKSIGLKLIKKEKEIIGVIWNSDVDDDPFALGTVAEWARDNGYCIVCDLPEDFLPLSAIPRRPNGLKEICAKHDIDYEFVMWGGRSPA